MRLASPCLRRLRAAARDLSEIERRLASKLDPWDRFEREPPNPVHEARVRRFLAEVFADDWTYRVECRSRVCRLTVEGHDLEWMQPLQEEGSRRALLDGAGFGNVDGRGFAAFLVIMKEPRSRGWLLRQEVAQRIRESTEIAECTRRFPAHGELRVRIEVSVDDRYDVAYQGSLVDTASAACVRSAIDAILWELPIPADTVWPDDNPLDLEVWQ